MALLTIDDDVALKVDEFAQKEEISREDFVKRAIGLYLHGKLMDEVNEHGKRLGITEEVIADEVKRGRPATARTAAETLRMAAERAADPNRKPLSRLFGKRPCLLNGDGVAYQRAIRDEWD